NGFHFHLNYHRLKLESGKLKHPFQTTSENCLPVHCLTLFQNPLKLTARGLASPGTATTTSTSDHGIRNLKKLSAWVALIGIALEKAPVPSSVPPALTVQLPNGSDKFVVVSQVKPRFGVPPLPVRIRLPPEI